MLCDHFAGENITVLTNDVYGIVYDATLPFPGFPADMKDVCKLGKSSSCPIKKGDSYTESVILPVTVLAPTNVRH